MQRLLTALGAFGSGLLLAVACSEDHTGNLFSDPDAGSIGGLPGNGGSGGSANGGRGGSGGAAGVGGGSAGSGGAAGSSSMPAGSGGQDAGAGAPACNGDVDCDDHNACTTERCQDGACVDTGFAAQGAVCGSSTDNPCTAPDTCNGAGVCLAKDEPNGSACTDGSCTAGQCINGQPVGCPIDVANSVPFDTTWSSVGRPDLFGGGCDEAGTPDYALVFKAPQAGTFRFSVHALVDSTPYTGADQTDPFTDPPDGDAVITVAADSCAGSGATQLDCNDDVTQGNLDSQLDLVLTDQQVVTVYLNERTQTGGGTGTLSVTLLL